MFTGYCGLIPSVTCINKLFYTLQTDYVNVMGQEYQQVKAIDLVGTLQKAGGIPGADIGHPVWDKNSPKEFMDTSCIHLTQEGYKFIFEALYQETGIQDD